MERRKNARNSVNGALGNLLGNEYVKNKVSLNIHSEMLTITLLYRFQNWHAEKSIKIT